MNLLSSIRIIFQNRFCMINVSGQWLRFMTIALAVTINLWNVTPAQAATITVTNANDSGAGSLRQAIADAASSDIITFAGDYTITLANELGIGKNLTISGAGHSVTLSGNNTVRIFNISGGGLTLDSLTLTQGKSTATNCMGGTFSCGGAINVQNGTTVTISNSTLSNNFADYGGGAIAIYHGTATIKNSTFLDNTNSLSSGGAIDSFYGNVNVTNSTFSGNTSSGNSFSRGGAIGITAGTLTLINNSFVDNVASRNGGAVSVVGTPTATTVKNNIFANNGAMNCNYNLGGLNNLATDSSCGTGSSVSSTILLGTLSDYGGPTPTIPLLPDSAAIDAGDSLTCATAPISSLDQRGKTRPAACDIGAFESQGFSLSKVGGDNQSTAIETAFPLPLQVAVSETGGNNLPGAVVTFTAPVSGSSTNPTTFTATTTATGISSATVTANSIIGGPYTVTASAPGATSVDFSLTNACVGSAVTITNDSDSGAGSLRQAITDVCAGGTITFDGNYTIPLSSELATNKNLTIDGAGHTVTISGNNASRIFHISSGTLILNNLTLANGYAGNGAAIYMEMHTGLSITNAVIHDNKTPPFPAYYTGGAIYGNYATVNVNNSSFYNNYASISGGAIRLDHSNMNITNSTFYNNSTSSYIGAISHWGGSIRLTNNTFVGNSGPQGANIDIGVDWGTSATLNNNIFVSGGGRSCTCDNFNSCPSFGANNFSSDGSCGGATIIPSSQAVFGALANYGGSTPTMPLLPGNPAIDGGNAAFCAGLPNGDYDQRGVGRWGTCDAGAFESQGFTFDSLTGTPQSTVINTAFPIDLGFSVIANASGEPVNGGVVSFSAPTNSASITNTAFDLTIAGGVVSQNVTANDTTGAYNVTASADGASDTSFALTNLGIYAVTYAHNPAGGTGVLPTQGDVVTNDTFTVASGSGLTRTGYTFSGWYDGMNTYQPADTYTMGTTNVTLTAEWTINSYTVTFDAAGGTPIPDDQMVSFGAKVAEPTEPTQSGYVFDGWFNGATAWDFAIDTVSGAITLTARWTKDITPPDTEIDSAPPTATNSPDATFTFLSPESGVTFECSIDSAPYSDCTSPQDYTGFADGPHTFEVRAIDAALNTDPTPAIHSWMIDTTSLSVSIEQAATQSDPTNASPILFTATFSKPIDLATFAASDLTFGGTAPGTLAAIITEIASNDGTTFEISVSGMTGTGAVSLSLPENLVADLSGNLNTTNTSIDNQVTYDVDILTVANLDLDAEYTGNGPKFFGITFNKPVFDPPDNSAPDDVTNPFNYLLIEKGINGQPDTLSCSGGLVADDHQITVSSVSYDAITYETRVTLFGNLPAGSYRLFICGTTSIVDLAGNILNNGYDYIFDFFVVSAPSALPNTGFAFGHVTRVPEQPTAKSYANTDLTLSIPTLGVKTTIVGVRRAENEWDVTWLNQSIGWLEGSAYPTWAGNSVLTGHVWDADNTPGIFADIKTLKYGDQFQIHAYGQTYTYEVRENRTVGTRGISTVFQSEEYDWVTLVTCEYYNPLTGDYTFRRMVRAVLVSVK